MVGEGMPFRKPVDVELLRALPVFSACTHDELEALATEADELIVESGTTLIRQGEHGCEFLVLVEGSADVWKNGRRINQLAGGDFLGEISLFSGAAPTATVTTTSRTRLLALTAEAFNRAIKQVPSARENILGVLSERLHADTLT
jgi:CRP-like cAMP-binding protein